MKCPRMFNGALVVVSKGTATDIDCLEEKCAQYDKEGKQCIEITKGQALKEIAKQLKKGLPK